VLLTFHRLLKTGLGNVELFINGQQCICAELWTQDSVIEVTWW